jgi:hypothetical protein
MTDRMTAKLLLALASAVILGSESHGPHDLILLSAKVKVKVTLQLAVHLQSVQLGAKHLEAYYQSFFSIEPLRSWSLCNILSDERMGLSLMNRLVLSSSVRIAQGFRECQSKSLSQSYSTCDGSRPISSSWRQPFWDSRQLFLFSWTHAALVLLWIEDGSVVYSCCWLSSAQSFSGPSPAGLLTIFYCLYCYCGLMPNEGLGVGDVFANRCLEMGIFPGSAIPLSPFMLKYIYAHTYKK